MLPSKNISFDELSKYFHLPINQVAKELGVCATILKKICRRNGIPRWPHRKIKSLDKMIANLEVNSAKNPAEREELKQEMELLRNKRTEIMKNPDILVSKSTGRRPSQAITTNMKRTHKPQRSVYTINTFQIKELSRAQEVDERDYSSDDANCWASPSVAHEQTVVQNVLVNLTDTTISPSIAAARRPSLPILDFGRMAPPKANRAASITILPPGRRHSVDSLPSRSPSFSLSGSPAYHNPPSIDLSQKLPDFHFNQGTEAFAHPLPCIEPSMNGSPAARPETKPSFPEWFIAEKSRVLGMNN